MKKFSLFAIIMALLFTGCEQNNPDNLDTNNKDNPASDLKIFTGITSEISKNSATLHGEINIDISSYISVRVGMMVSEDSAELNQYNGKMYHTNALIGKDFIVFVDDLKPNTLYHYRAWIYLNQSQYEFGDIKEFTTEALPNNGFENNHEWVELGLSVKWATCNVGANSPEKYGDYYAWGEIKEKYSYEWETYKFGYYYTYPDGTSKYYYTKYDHLSLETLVESDDVASVEWGGNWHIPSESNWKELLEKCTWEWTTQNGVNGYKITSTIKDFTSNSIFLPAAGRRMLDSLVCAGEEGAYWSNLLADYDSYYSGPEYAYAVYFRSDYIRWKEEQRIVGVTVRPVCP